MRPGSCNLMLDSDYKGLLAYMDCSSLVTSHRKNDQERKGHWMHFGKSADPALDLDYQLGLFMDMAHTRPSDSCAVGQLREKRCLPSLPRARQTRGSWVLHPDPTTSPACISAMVIADLSMIGVDTTAFSGVCCRTGGLTVATEEGVPD